MKRTIYTLALALTLSGCGTFQGLQKDVDGVFSSIDQKLNTEHAAREGALITIADCPQVEVGEDLRHMTEFSDPENPSDSNKLAEIHIAGIEQTCTYKENHADMQINLALDGTIGPKARVKQSDQANISFPYFVAVTDENENILAKEVFAANVSNGAGKNDINQKETIFQQLPFNADGQLPYYRVVVGFQLSPEQLAFNRAGLQTAAGDEPESVEAEQDNAPAQ